MGSMTPYHEWDESRKVHLYCVWLKRPKGKKTAIYSVRKGEHRFRDGAIELGKIRWWGAWRQYVFFPDTETLWSIGCLDMICKFLKTLNDNHRRRLKKNAT